MSQSIEPAMYTAKKVVNANGDTTQEDVSSDPGQMNEFYGVVDLSGSHSGPLPDDDGQFLNVDSRELREGAQPVIDNGVPHQTQDTLEADSLNVSMLMSREDAHAEDPFQVNNDSSLHTDSQQRPGVNQHEQQRYTNPSRFNTAVSLPNPTQDPALNNVCQDVAAMTVETDIDPCIASENYNDENLSKHDTATTVEGCYQEEPPVSESTVVDNINEVGLDWRDTDSGDQDFRETGVDQSSPSRARKDDEDGASDSFKQSGDNNTALETDVDSKHPDGAFSESESANDDDFASGAAIAMAAVAAAASAFTSSPSAAAEAARAIAPNLVPETISTRKENITIVRLPAVKAQMMKRIDAAHKANHIYTEHGSDSQHHRDVVEQRLALGENDAFLQYLLLFQYFKTCDENNESSDASLALGELPDPASVDGQSKGQNSVLTSAEKVRSMLHMAEEAYDAMEALLPPMPIESSIKIDAGDAEYYGIDAPPVVPDLLPPCTSVPGDATQQFFLACCGELEVEKLEGTVCDSLPIDDNASDSGTTIADSTNESVNADPIGVSKSATSMFTSMFSSMTRATKHQTVRPTSTTLAGVFRIRRPNEPGSSEKDLETLSRPVVDSELAAGEYSVSIDREMLGLTVENVLERTVVRTVLPGGAAKKAGAKVGSLIVKVGNVETKNLTHFETIDELRQSQRPLKLILRQIPVDSLRSAREEMGRLIRGGGFGSALAAEQNETSEGDKRSTAPNHRKTYHGKPGNVEALSQVLHQRWSKDGTTYTSKKEEALVQAGEKLVWILTLLVVGLEREASKAPSATARESVMDGSPGRRSHTSHVIEDYVDASKSVSKVLLDFVTYRLLAGEQRGDSDENPLELMRDNTGNRLRRGPQPPPSERHGARARAQDAMNAKRSRDAHNLLLRIGDVLHRTRSFLADPASPPAALVRGEVISFLCDVLDIDIDMELSEEEGGSPNAGITAAPLNDLGSAGSLLKLIILNCSMMRSPGCTSFRDANNELDVEAEQRRRFGTLKTHVNGLDLHRFHAGNRFLSVVHRLAASRSISARITACSLGPVLWGHLDFPHQLQLRGVITRALHDVDVIVRKSTACVLHEIAELIFDPRAVPWLVLMCERAMTDPEPQLRAAAMTLTWHLSEHLPNAFLGDASEGSRSLRRLPSRSDPTFAEVYLLQCKLLPVATRLAEDRAPSVRLAVAAQCDRLCNSLGEHWYSVILDVLQALLGDVDENVRGEAILCVPRLAEIVLMTSKPERAGVGVLEALLPVSVKLLNDPSPNVRVALATAAGDLLTLLVGLQSLHEISPPSAGDQLSEVTEKSNKKHVDETLIPLLQKLLNDSEPEVTSAALRAVTNASRGNVREIRSRRDSRAGDDDTVSLSSYQSHTSLERKDPVFIPVLSEEQVMRLLPTLTGLANSRQWRVRQGAVEIIPALLGCTSKLEIRSEVAQLCFRLMNDKVDAVRRTAAECLCLSGGGLGSHGEGSAVEWITAIVIPHVRSCSQSIDSKQRILCLKMVEVILVNGICPVKRKNTRHIEFAESRSLPPRLELLDIAVSLSLDAVANVRLNFGRLALSVISIIDDEELATLTKALDDQIIAEQTHERGGDRDVLFFAIRALMRSREKEEISLPFLQDGSER